MRTLITALLIAVSGNAFADPVHYIELVNTAPTSITAFAVAAPGSDDYREIGLGGKPVHGGGDSTTIAIADGEGCLRDFRTQFGDGRVLVQKSFNICKLRSYHTGQYLRRGEEGLRVAQP